MHSCFRLFLCTLATGLASTVVYAGETCRTPQGRWDHACLQQHYSAPIQRWPKPTIEGSGQWREMEAVSTPDLQKTAPYPKLRLGIRLFYDTALSASGKLACASCHRPENAFADKLAISPGHDGRLGNRNAPALVGVKHASSLFWDGRSPTLELQALIPIAAPVEMAMPLAELPGKLTAIPGYAEDFNRAFGDPHISLERIQQALAAYQRTLVPRVTSYDRFLSGDMQALQAQELLGLHLFRTKARCMTCHQGPELSDHQFHNLGLTYFGRKYEDLGRYLVTGDNKDVGKFKTPTLRNVSQSGPWMHNGLFKSLRGIVNMYNVGMPRPQPTNAVQAADPRFPVNSELLKPLQLTEEEMQALTAFLNAL